MEETDVQLEEINAQVCERQVSFRSFRFETQTTKDKVALPGCRSNLHRWLKTHVKGKSIVEPSKKCSDHNPHRVRLGL